MIFPRLGKHHQCEWCEDFASIRFKTSKSSRYSCFIKTHESKTLRLMHLDGVAWIEKCTSANPFPIRKKAKP